MTLPRPEYAIRPRPRRRLDVARRCARRRPRAQASRLSADSRPRPPPTATRTSAARHVTDTQLQEYECSERSSIRRRGVAGESPHLRGISRQKQNKPLHQRHAALPHCALLPSKKQTRKEKPTSRMTTPKNPTVNHWTESSSSASISSTASATCECQCQMCPSEK